MCNYFSCIIDRKGQVYWLKKSNSHEDIIHINKLKDNKIEDRNFVRIEIVPKDEKEVTRNKKDWIFKVDEVKTLPKWYTKNKKQNEKLCWEEWKKSVKEQIVINDEKRIVKNTYVIASGNSKIEAYGKSYVEAYGNSHIEAYDRSQVYSYDISQVKAHNCSKIEARDNSCVEAYDNSCVETYDNSKVEAKGSSSIEACDISQVIAQGNSCVEAYDNSCVRAYENSHIKTRGNCQVNAFGTSVIHKFSGNIKLKSNTCVCIDHINNTLILKEGAKLKFQKVDKNKKGIKNG